MPRRSTPADPFKAREHKLPSHASRMDSQTCQRPLAQGFVRTTRRILVGDLVKERASHAKAFVEVEAGSCGLLFFFRCSSAKAGHACAALAASQVGPHHLQIFDVELRLSRLVARNDVLLRKSGLASGPTSPELQSSAVQEGWKHRAVRETHDPATPAHFRARACLGAKSPRPMLTQMPWRPPFVRPRHKSKRPCSLEMRKMLMPSWYLD